MDGTAVVEARPNTNVPTKNPGMCGYYEEALLLFFLREHSDNIPCGPQLSKRKKDGECRVKEFIFISLTWDC